VTATTTTTERPATGPAFPAPAPAPGAGRAIATIAVNEIRMLTRDRVALLFIVVLPAAIIFIIGSTFGSMDSFTVGLVDRDGTAASRDLVAALDRGEGISVDTFDSPDALRREVRSGTIGAGVVVPDGYGAALASPGGATVDLVADRSSAAAAATQAAVRAAVGDAAVRIAAARTASEATGVDPDRARELADEVAGELPRAGVRTEAVGEGEEATLGSFSYTAPSNLVLFTFINTLVAGAYLANERRQGITRRMLATPHGTGTILAGIGAARLLFALLQSALIVGIGSLVFGVEWGDPLGATLLVVLFAAVATAVALLVGSIVDEPDQAQAAGVPIAIALGMLGGCMWPLEIVPSVMRAIGHVAPHAWAMDAWIALIFDGEGVAGIAPQLAVLAGFALVLGLFARHRLRRALTT
jgi:ABC-2 type transport system permease protein